jgi:hypothetical protein
MLQCLSFARQSLAIEVSHVFAGLASTRIDGLTSALTITNDGKCAIGVRYSHFGVASLEGCQAPID